MSAWKAAAQEAVSKTLFGVSSFRSEAADVLLVLLSFLSASGKIPLDLLIYGSSPRKRWTWPGEIESVDATEVGLVPELADLLSNTQQLEATVSELCRLLTTRISKNTDRTCTLEAGVAARICGSLSSDQAAFWRGQALIVAYRAVPWKYLEPPATVIQLFLPHVRRTTGYFQDSFQEIPTHTRTDLVLTLLEASRFPDMAWRHFAVDQAEAASGGLEDQYLRLCIGQSRSLLGRLSENMEEAVSSLRDLPVEGSDKRTHAAIGLANFQRCLNSSQVEDHATARKVLEDWDYLDENPSPMERVVCFRKHMLLGRLLRYQGEFRDSLKHFEMARKATEQHSEIILDEELRDFTCDLADTLRELDDPATGERLLRAEIARRKENPSPFFGRSWPELSLAETLFAQEKFKEAEEICLDIQSRPNHLKFTKLRLNIILAKIRHVNSDLEAALSCWSEAMEAMQKFPFVSGRVARIITMSIADILDAQGHNWVARESPRRGSVDVKPEGIRYWIAGFRHWADYLQSRGAQCDF
ncbi:hypothetical protein ACJ41O_010144 [Fusarium nematophilum]